jgi:hypothetical protein
MFELLPFCICLLRWLIFLTFYNFFFLHHIQKNKIKMKVCFITMKKRRAKDSIFLDLLSEVIDGAKLLLIKLN